MNLIKKFGKRNLQNLEDLLMDYGIGLHTESLLDGHAGTLWDGSDLKNLKQNIEDVSEVSPPQAIYSLYERQHIRAFVVITLRYPLKKMPLLVNTHYKLQREIAKWRLKINK